MSRGSFERADYVVIVGIALAIAVVIACLIVDGSARADCEDKGGRVVEYNCTTSMVCTTSGDGNHSYTACQPMTSCNWRCDGLQAESPLK